MIMVQAGPATDAVIDELVPLLDEGDVVIDGGNARYPDSVRRAATLAPKGLHFVGCGVSGGEEGALLGPSIMPGCSAEAYALIGPLLESIAAVVDGTPCCTHVGTDGAGHFVKMVHNGIEYADMQLIAEAYDLLRLRLGLTPAEIGDVFAGWNEGELESYLVEITAEVLRHVDADTGQPFVDVVMDAAEQKGTGRWTVQSALDLGVPVSGIAEAVFARALSGHAEQRAAAQKVLAAPGDAPADDRGPRRLRRGRPAGALRLEGGRLRPGLRPDRRGRAGEQLEHRPRRAGHHLARRLHHPRPVPRPDPAGVRRRADPDHAADPRLLPRRGGRRAGELAARGGRGGAERHPRARVRQLAGLLRRPAGRAVVRRR